MHILVAVLSLITATVLLIAPSVSLLRTTYGLFAATVLSGTYVAVRNGEHLVQTCLTGLAYIAFVSAALLVARRQLAREHVTVRDQSTRR